MKKLIIASAVCIFPLFLLGIVNPIVTLIGNDGKIKNFNLFLVYVGICAVCLAVITTTVLLLQKYASKIDHLDEEERRIYQKERQLETLISRYNSMIAEGVHK